jgi:hypothetical protein
VIWDFGNRCGHRRESPRLRLAREPKRRRPPLVRKLMSCAERLYWRTRILGMAGVAARSELREAIVLVIKALLLNWDQVTSRVLWGPDGGGQRFGVPLEVIASWTGLNIGRVVRAVAALRHAGLLQGGQPCELRPDGRWIGYAAVRRISWRLFYLMGIDRNELEQAAAAAQQRRAAAATPAPARRERREGDPTSPEEILAGLANERARQAHRRERLEAERLERLRQLGTKPPPE